MQGQNAKAVHARAAAWGMSVHVRHAVLVPEQFPMAVLPALRASRDIRLNSNEQIISPENVAASSWNEVGQVNDVGTANRPAGPVRRMAAETPIRQSRRGKHFKQVKLSAHRSSLVTWRCNFAATLTRIA